MNIFDTQRKLIGDYRAYLGSFMQFRDQRIRAAVERELEERTFFPDPMLQLNPQFKPGCGIADLIAEGILHPRCAAIFRLEKSDTDRRGRELPLYKHQEEAIRRAFAGDNYILTTGTGSGKSLAYIVPIVNHALLNPTPSRIKAIVLYPMNALANSQRDELRKYLNHLEGDGECPTFAVYTGQQSDSEREKIAETPPDILLTNYMMLELILTRNSGTLNKWDKRITEAASGLRCLVLDELHTYRGRQGADVAMLVRRLREALSAPDMQCVGTSATLSGAKTLPEQQSEIAAMASRLFGAKVKPESVIGETLLRFTDSADGAEAAYLDALRISVIEHLLPSTLEEAKAHPLAQWLEDTVGLRFDEKNHHLRRQRPQALTCLGQDLAQRTSMPEEMCRAAIEGLLLRISELQTDKRAALNFRLHQFISQSGAVHTTLEAPDDRHLTLKAQSSVRQGDKHIPLFPLCFCRECGQEFYTVWKDKSGGQVMARGFREQRSDADTGKDAGYLFRLEGNPWPEFLTEEAGFERLPDDWLEPDPKTPESQRVIPARKDKLPQPIKLDVAGAITDDGCSLFHYVPVPFLFCPQCGVGYDTVSSTGEYGKLAVLSLEGRSTATTLLCLSLLRQMKADPSWRELGGAKLLSFTDNRQDASLQSGHFNDFIDVALVRGAMYCALVEAGAQGLRHYELAGRCLDGLQLEPESYAQQADVQYAKPERARQALADVLAYRIYRDQQRGWRVNYPNLEQVGLLEVDYESLDQLTNDEDRWSGLHPALKNVTPDLRSEVARTLLDHLRRELVLSADELDPDRQGELRQRSNQLLVEPWALDENENMEARRVAVAGPGTGQRSYAFLTGRGGFGRYLRRILKTLKSSDADTVIKDLLEALCIPGILQRVPPTKRQPHPGYVVKVDSIIWRVGDGHRRYHDRIRIPNPPENGLKPNQFFLDFYRRVALGLRGVRSREHTAQVRSAVREEREQWFREGKLALLFCSPTMELGIDISALNAVNMRNVPPTPANYAQRSGRAGRGGQPALVFTFCNLSNSHDQYYFHRPEAMVSGQVSLPQLELSNEELLRAHVNAIWLRETGADLGGSVRDTVELSAELPIKAELQKVLFDSEALKRAEAKARRIIDTLRDSKELTAATASWFNERWLPSELECMPLKLDAALQRWRGLWLAAVEVHQRQGQRSIDFMLSPADRDQAKTLHREAQRQLEILGGEDKKFQSDFYTYRYLAGEGFLPGYNFPRLPLSAYLPGGRRVADDEFLSRPRFLAISEFGPKALVYHEGARYEIVRAILHPDRADLTGETICRCCDCGYCFKTADADDGQDACHNPYCRGTRIDRFAHALRMENVVARLRQRISCDEEERERRGFEIFTGIQFAQVDNEPQLETATIYEGAAEVGTLQLAEAATITRINNGWRYRKKYTGFYIDKLTGRWLEEADFKKADSSPVNVIPYVQDTKNCLLLTIEGAASDAPVMASLQAALKRAIQAEYQLEDSEIAADPLPGPEERNVILLYEASEGGAGVLRQIVRDSSALGRIARRALQICHYDEQGGDVLPDDGTPCDVACYGCLMSYGNQHDHRFLDRGAIRDLLISLTRATVQPSPVAAPRTEHYSRLLERCDSGLERRFLECLNSCGLRLPKGSQELIEACMTRPDFHYDDPPAVIYVDGPPHDNPERQQRDAAQEQQLKAQGYLILRFHHEADWMGMIAEYPSVFGASR